MSAKPFRAKWLRALQALSLLVCSGAFCQIAHAQAIVLSVDGSAITTYDIAQRMKLLRILRKPASREDAINSLIADQLKLEEMSKFTITFTEADLAAQGARDAKAAKIPPAQLSQELQSSGLDPSNWRDHFKAQGEWEMYVKTLNKAVDVSTQEVRADMARKGESSAVTEYMLRRVVVVVPNPSSMQAKMREAQELRGKFDGCQSGVSEARKMPDVVVRELTTRTSADLSGPLRTLLDKTPVGRLTPPEPAADGVEMLAICGRNAVRDDAEAGASIRKQLINDRLKQASAELYRKLRARAVIVRR